MGCSCSIIEEHENLNSIQSSKVIDLNEKYEFVSMIGQGGYGKVRLYRDRYCPELKYAIKTISKDLLKPEMLGFMKHEIRILKELDHPNIVKYRDSFENTRDIHIVMEYIPGESLASVLKNKKFNNFSNYDAINLTENLLKAILFLHNKNIVHQDIKGENILFSKQGKLLFIKGFYDTIKLIDFGLSRKNINLHSKNIAGSTYYVAPEILDGRPNLKSDIWSVGVLMYLMLTGKFPFDGISRTEIFHKINKCDYDRKILQESKISEESIDLISKMLSTDLILRISTSDALNHPCFEINKKKIEKTVINSEILQSLKNFTKASLLKKEILFILAKLSDDDEIKKLREAFLKIDKDNTGTIDYNEIYSVFKIIGIEPNEVIKTLFRKKLKKFGTA